ncbi:CRAL/TRIO domain-containing protein [Skeletonema marinoi]|uniref:CRAL/TRIO domain-containing protein n=1 Tax=Skeletonema marinoi TaxID=267567 RepID=A0AAD8YPY5_9STRA|nr:CRAL/TRIO domain-containing protein [Skeletonema marinoi]
MNGGSTSASPPGQWTADELMHGKAGDVSPPTSPNGSATTSGGQKKRFSMKAMRSPAKKSTDPLDWGMPGHLTKEEVDVFMKFRDEVEKRGGEFKSTVYSFSLIEGEAYCLTRWLRARKFVYDDVIAMVEEATEVRADARMHEFYPDPVSALGCGPSLFMHCYPQLYPGKAKNGCPIFISKPGVLNTDAMECITSLDGILKFHWHVMMHDYKQRLMEHKKAHPDFCNFQTVTVIDLEHLSTSQLSKRALSIVKTQTAIDSVCFPETMNRTLVINAPRFFSMTWGIIKGWIDPRTASKIELISSRKTWEARLRELCDEDEIPSDYGGKGPATTSALEKEYAPEGVLKEHFQLVHVGSSGHYNVAVPAGSEMEVTVWSRSVNEVIVSIVDENVKSKVFVGGVTFTHTGGTGDNDKPSSLLLTKERIVGPAKTKIKFESKAGRFSSAGNYFVSCSMFDKK